MNSRPALTALSLCILLPALGTSSANVALPTLAHAFGAPMRTAQWVVLAYLLAITTMIVSVGRLADVAGRRRLLLGGIAVFTAASAACGFAPTLPALIAARTVQGIGAAAMMALALPFVADTIPKEQTGRAMGLLGTASAVGTAVGPSLSGLLVGGFGWPATFLAPVPAALAAAWLAWRCLPADRALTVARERFDLRGTVLLSATLGLYALAMTAGRAALLLAAVVGVILFLRSQRGSSSPLLRLELLADRTRSAALAANALVTTVVMATLVAGPFYLAEALGLDAARVGLVLSAGPIVAALAGVPAGASVDRFGSRRTALAALITMAAGVAALSVTPAWFGITGWIAPLVTITAGYALFQAANNTAVMAGVPADRRGVVSGLLNLSRNLGLITGASFMGSVFASAEDAAAGLRRTSGVAAVLVLAALAIALRGMQRPRREEENPETTAVRSVSPAWFARPSRLDTSALRVHARFSSRPAGRTAAADDE